MFWIICKIMMIRDIWQNLKDKIDQIDLTLKKVMYDEQYVIRSPKVKSDSTL